MDRLEALKVYCQIIDSGGLNKAAKTLGISPPLVSHCLARLETQYGTRLLERSTRRMSVTDAGLRLYQHALRLLDDFHAIETDVQTISTQPKGKLRVTLPLGLATVFIYRRLHEFTQRYPDISLDLQVNDRFIDLVEGSFDVGLRAGVLPDSEAIAILLTRYRRVICASPDYVHIQGQPKHPKDLSHHRCLVYRHDQSPVQWPFWISRAVKLIQVSAYHAANESNALLAMARAGMGLTGQPEWLVADDLKSGRLVTILDDFVIPPSNRSPGIYAILPSGRFRTAKVNAFIQFARDCVKRNMSMLTE